ncbi:MAG TPA: PRC-barrel domain-containing protein [Azospirillum sp.]|nr:PRC-barrel domain-containing protein [Azospirillum sp.]
MRSLRLVLPVYALLAGLAVAQQQPLMPVPRPNDRAGTEMQLVTPAARRALTAAEAQALIGRSVRTRDGQSAGEIRDFTLAGPDGRIDRIIMAVGGFLGIGTRIYSVPAATLRVGAASKVQEMGQPRPMDVTLDLTADDLEEAPEFAYEVDTHTLVGRR